MYFYKGEMDYVMERIVVYTERITGLKLFETFGTRNRKLLLEMGWS